METFRYIWIDETFAIETLARTWLVLAMEDSAIVAIDPIDIVTIQIFERRLIVPFCGLSRT